MYDAPQGKVATVERLLQLLAVLRASDTPVPRATIVDRVQAYAKKRADGMSAEGLAKTLENDLNALRGVGFAIDDVAAPGEASRFALRPTSWRVPLDLSDFDQGLLSWVFRVVEAEEPPSQSAMTTSPDAFDALLGRVPHNLGIVQAALAGRRRLLIIDKRGQQQALEPVRLVLYARRWKLLARYEGRPQVYGFSVDGLDDPQLGSVFRPSLERVRDLDVLDPTWWDVDDEISDIEIHCDAEDLTAVRSWFPRAEVEPQSDEAVLRFEARHVAAVVDRVIGLAGAARLVSPEQAVERLVSKISPFLETS